MAGTYSYQEIIDQIDDAIYAFSASDKPVAITIDGRSKTYRSLGELQAARTYYANLLRSQSGAQGFQLTRIKPGGPV